MTENKNPRLKESQPGKDKNPKKGNGNKLPKFLENRKSFCIWKYGELRKNGKKSKVPYNPFTGIKTGSTKLPTCSYKDACRAAKKYEMEGVGVVFDGSGLTGIDLDDCIDSAGTVHADAQAVIDRFDSYTELSPSGKGFHILIQVKKGLKIGKRKGMFELYSHGRFFTFTGDVYHPGKVRKRTKFFKALADSLSSPVDTPDKISTGKDTIDEIRTLAAPFSNSKKINRLAMGNTDGFESASEADLSLCTYLAYLTNQNADEVDRLFRGSALYRAKWERDDYRNETIDKATEASLRKFENRDEVKITRASVKDIIIQMHALEEVVTREKIAREIIPYNDFVGRKKLFATLRSMKQDCIIAIGMGGQIIFPEMIENFFTEGLVDDMDLPKHPVVMPAGIHQFVPHLPGYSTLIHANTDAGKTYFACQMFIDNIIVGNRTIYICAENSRLEIFDIIKNILNSCSELPTVTEFQAIALKTKSDLCERKYIINSDKDAVCIFDYLKVQGDFSKLAPAASRMSDEFTNSDGVLFVFAQRNKGKREPLGGDGVTHGFRNVLSIGMSSKVSDDVRFLNFIKVKKNFGAKGKYIKYRIMAKIEDSSIELMTKEPLKSMSQSKSKPSQIKSDYKIVAYSQRLFTFMKENDLEMMPIQEAQELVSKWTGGAKKQVTGTCRMFKHKNIGGVRYYIRDSYSGAKTIEAKPF